MINTSKKRNMNLNEKALKVASEKELNSIKVAVEKIFNLPDISSKKSNYEYVTARQTYYYIALLRTKNNKHQIGKFVNKDHATLINAQMKLPANLRYDENFRRLFAQALKEFDVKNEWEHLYEMNVPEPVKAPEGITATEEQKEIISMIMEIPEKHLPTVKMRLKPMIAMLNY